MCSDDDTQFKQFNSVLRMSLLELRTRAAELEAKLDVLRAEIQAQCPALIAIRSCHDLYVAADSGSVLASESRFFFRAHWLDATRVVFEVPGMSAGALAFDARAADILARVQHALTLSGGDCDAANDADIGDDDGPGASSPSAARSAAAPRSSTAARDSPFRNRVFLSVTGPVQANFLGVGRRPHHVALCAVPVIFEVRRADEDAAAAVAEPWTSPAAAEAAAAVAERADSASAGTAPGDAPCVARQFNRVALRDTSRNRYVGADRTFYGANVDCDSERVGEWEVFDLVPAATRAHTRPLADTDAHLLRALGVLARI